MLDMFLDMSETKKQEKLLEVLQNNEVSITKKGYICLSEFVDNIIESKDPKQYVKRLRRNGLIEKDEEYMSPDTCIDVLKGSNLKKCKEICQVIDYDEYDKKTVIDIEENIFKYKGHTFSTYCVEITEGDYDMWFYASDVAKYLGYADHQQAIRDHVDEDNIMTFEKFNDLFDIVKKTLPKNPCKKTKLINLSGFSNLIHTSDKPFAKKIRRWMDSEVMPSIYKYGRYTMAPKNFKITSFYDKNSLATYEGKNVLYIGYIGEYKDEHIFKYGITAHIYSRDRTQHRKQFGKFEVVMIIECDNNKYVEKLFKQEVHARGLERPIEINGVTKIELFAVTYKYTHEYFMDKLEILVQENELPSLKKANQKIKKLEKKCDIANDRINELEEIIKNDRQNEKLRLELEMKRLDFQRSEVQSLNKPKKNTKSSKTVSTSKYASKKSPIVKL
jgi:prophage antirepressor-like protein